MYLFLYLCLYTSVFLYVSLCIYSCVVSCFLCDAGLTRSRNMHRFRKIPLITLVRKLICEHPGTGTPGVLPVTRKDLGRSRPGVTSARRFSSAAGSGPLRWILALFLFCKVFVAVLISSEESVFLNFATAAFA